ncbi:hypothetical protein [Streptomyces sp. I05A-00742]|uniref:hypothetical protein n=1 Tax=Streptomyces sp. I05A-00742 TaxID=2732853 RepID=UPI00148830A5|nr:hypothetical protein [Streptomyces sp. I05A-00742]
MGWTVLYFAFGVVALWLLAEVLLQYKARLRWRLLAFTGFLGVVAGVVIPSVAVIAVGAIAFAIGQVYVTLSFRRGFSAGWSLRRKGRGDDGPAAAPEAPAAPGRSGRRRGRGERNAGTPAPAPPAPGTPGAGKRLTAAEADAATAMMPAVPQQPTTERPVPGDAFPPAEETATVFGVYDPPAAYDSAAPGGYSAEHTGQYGYGQEQGQYAAYSDPYIAAHPPAYEQYDAYGQQGAYGAYPQPYPQGGEGYASAPAPAPAPSQQYDMDTPPGGVWVPQQRGTEAGPQPRDQQGYGY